MESLPTLHLLTTSIIMNGLVVSLSVVCLLHYILTIHRRKQAEEELKQTLKQVEYVQFELDGLKLSHNLSRLENRLLRDILGTPDIRIYIDTLFERLLPNTQEGLCALYSIENEKQTVLNYRGERSSFATKGIPRDLLEQMRGEHTLKLEQKDLEQSGLLKFVNRETRPFLDKVFIFTTPEIDGIRYLFITSALYPSNVNLNEQLEFTRRLVRGIDIRLRQQGQLQEQLEQLQLTQVKLEMQNLIGSNLQGFLQKLVELTETDRCMLYLVENEKQELRKAPLIKLEHGPGNNPNLEFKRSKDEYYLATLVKMSNKDFINLNKASLEKVKITETINQAILLSLRSQDGNLLAVACLTRSSCLPYSPRHVEFVQWASPLIADCVSKTLSEAIVRRKATLDGLTKIANRRTFDERITQELFVAKSQQTTCSLVLIDLDHFKNINDRHGHQVGDTVLKETADILKRITNQTRTNDSVLVARYGGEEMAILLPGVSAAGALRITESIRKARETTPGLSEHGEFLITMSSGISSFPENASDVEGMIKAADEALYKAKHAGRNQTLVSTTSEKDRAIEGPKGLTSQVKPKLRQSEKASPAMYQN
ncbi:Phytochrome-like protein cph2 [Polystyrenella longa]|uniref:diguanylate cyclase n=1 Tax=Polystyrenella longa TaxID=2528007 RepID=A0A518CLZ8_9PLAN|nr:sensor domain-containing diguanylate cyclase [Polystyrenella longa]QDU80245.1 Phytochrome-like protein cph2 [Polystyrenella longa]